LGWLGQRGQAAIAAESRVVAGDVRLPCCWCRATGGLLVRRARAVAGVVGVVRGRGVRVGLAGLGGFASRIPMQSRMRCTYFIGGVGTLLRSLAAVACSRCVDVGWGGAWGGQGIGLGASESCTGRWEPRNRAGPAAAVNGRQAPAERLLGPVSFVCPCVAVVCAGRRWAGILRGCCARGGKGPSARVRCALREALRPSPIDE